MVNKNRQVTLLLYYINIFTNNSGQNNKTNRPRDKSSSEKPKGFCRPNKDRRQLALGGKVERFFFVSFLLLLLLFFFFETGVPGGKNQEVYALGGCPLCKMDKRVSLWSRLDERSQRAQRLQPNGKEMCRGGAG